MRRQGIDEKQLAAYIDAYVQGRWGRLLDRHFQGTIATVTGAGPYSITLTRTGEGVADGNTYLCATPGYVPAVGDVVECMWRDQVTAYVLWKLPAGQ